MRPSFISYFSLASLRQCQPFPLAGFSVGFSLAAKAGAASKTTNRVVSANFDMTALSFCAASGERRKWLPAPRKNLSSCKFAFKSFKKLNSPARKRTSAAHNKINVYSITSSARASSEGGTVRPSALALLRLMASSNLVGNSTGRSLGFSPLRMRAA
jgi:hypothetical protein